MTTATARISGTPNAGPGYVGAASAPDGPGRVVAVDATSGASFTNAVAASRGASADQAPTWGGGDGGQQFSQAPPEGSYTPLMGRAAAVFHINEQATEASQAAEAAAEPVIPRTITVQGVGTSEFNMRVVAGKDVTAGRTVNQYY